MSVKKLKKLISFFHFKDENEALVCGFAGSGAFDGMYEAVEILKMDRERKKLKSDR